MSIADMMEALRKQQESTIDLYTAAAREGRRSLAQRIINELDESTKKDATHQEMLQVVIKILKEITEEQHG